MATDSGETLRFYKADRARATPEPLRELLPGELWRYTQPLQTNFTPRGSRYVASASLAFHDLSLTSACRECILHCCAIGPMHTSNFVNRLLRWTLPVGPNAVAILAMRTRQGVPSTTETAMHKLQPTTPAAQRRAAARWQPARRSSAARQRRARAGGATTTIIKESEKTSVVRKSKTRWGCATYRGLHGVLLNRCRAWFMW